MATFGPNNIPYDSTTVARFKSYAGDGTGGGTGLASAFNAANWTRTSDGNQIDWTNINAVPFSTGSASYTVTPATNSATAGVPPVPYKINAVGNWVSGNTYNYGDVVLSTIGGGGTGASYILSREPLQITNVTNNGSGLNNVSVTSNVVTLSFNNMGTPFTAGNLVFVTGCQNATFLNGVTLTVSTATGTSLTAAFTFPNYPSTAETAAGGTGQAGASVSRADILSFTGTAGTFSTLTAGDVVVFSGLTQIQELNGQTGTVLASPAPTTTSFAVNHTHQWVNNIVDQGYATIRLSGTTRPETDTKNYIAYNYEIWKTQDSQNAAISKIASGPTGGQAANTTLYVASSTIPGTVTSVSPTSTNLWHPGFIISVTGLSNASYNGTWTIQNSFQGETDTITAIQVTSNVITYTANNTLSVGQYLTVSGLTNGFGNISGTVTAATSTTFSLALTHADVALTADSGTAVANPQFTVVTFASDIAVTTDAGTGTYTMDPICFKVEHFAAQTTAAPWIRMSWGNGTDGVGNLTGNCTGASGGNGYSRFITSNRVGNEVEDSFPGLAGQGASTFKSVWSGESALNAGSRFGGIMWYNTSAGAAQASIPIYFGVERARDLYGNAIDDYFTYVIGCTTFAQFSGTNNGQRSLWKISPTMKVTHVSIDGSNVLTVNYAAATANNNYNYTFQPGAIVYLSGLQNSSFLNGQFVIVKTAPSSTSFTASFTHAAFDADDNGHAQLSISQTAMTRMTGTGNVQTRDRQVCSIQFALSSAILNGNTTMFPIFPVVGRVASPLTQFMILKQNDVTADGTITNSGNTGPTVYGATNKPYFLVKDGNNQPFTSMTPGNSWAAALRWE